MERMGGLGDMGRVFAITLLLVPCAFRSGFRWLFADLTRKHTKTHTHTLTHVHEDAHNSVGACKVMHAFAGACAEWFGLG